MLMSFLEQTDELPHPQDYPTHHHRSKPRLDPLTVCLFSEMLKNMSSLNSHLKTKGKKKKYNTVKLLEIYLEQ